MKVEIDMYIDKENIISYILRDLADHFIFEVNDQVIKEAIADYIESDTEYEVTPCAVPSSEVDAVKEEFIKYLNNLIKQLS